MFYKRLNGKSWIVRLSFLTGSLWCLFLPAVAAQHTVDLSGNWSFQLDDAQVGVRERWFEKDLKDDILLPGSTDERGFGVKAAQPERMRLTREHRYLGPAWYQKTIEIPASWQHRHVQLFLERAMWETKAWLDDHYIGMADSLCVPHRLDLSDYITPGRHRLTLRIDNRLKVNVGHDNVGGWFRMWAMCLTDESQTTWNGAIGRLEINVSDSVWIERIETYPNLDKKETRVVAFVRSRVGAVTGELTASAVCDGHTMGPVTANFRTKASEDRSGRDGFSPLLSDLAGAFYARRAVTRVEIILPFGKEAKLWDEFSPSIYKVKVSLSAQAQEKTYCDEYRDTLGLRKFEAEGKRFKLNGRTVFLRGNQDNCIHPKTGYPPMDKPAWLAFLQKHKDYGLNNMRFHSWCPPKAAFQAADELGMFVHVECPLWDGHGGIGYPPARAAFIRYEAERILDEYGNHPSFCFWSAGNELGNAREHYLQYLVEVLRHRDKRHLYTCTSHPAGTERNDDFFVAAHGRSQARGLYHMGGRNHGDYRQAIEGFKSPFVSHEIGQWTSFPDFYSWFNEAKYTGPLKARYIGILKEQFEKFHPPKRGPAFAKASGALQLLLYKAEIEAMLRTPTMAGFHLNGLVDYPGEGIALIGMLDAMTDSKDIAAPEEFRRFCSETVPLARLPKQNWQAGEVFEVIAEVRHHGSVDLLGRQWRWRIAGQTGQSLQEGTLGKHDVPTGELTSLGKIKAQLPQIRKAKELTLHLWMDTSDVKNAWHFWVYPAIDSLKPPAGVLVVDAWSRQVKETLKSGGRVLLTPVKKVVKKTVDIHFWTVFWGRGLFPHMPRPMGIFCDPAHPALAQFPTREHSDWQWYDLMTGAYALSLNNLPFEYEPVVHLIDDFNLSHRLAVVMEAKVGKGRLVVSTLNLGQEGRRTLSQRQMLKSLLARAAASDFESLQRLSLEQLDGLFRSMMTEWQEAHTGRKPALGDPLFVEDFKALEGGSTGTQLQSGLPLKHLASLRGWKAQGFNAIHAVQRTDKTWAFQVLASDGGHNTLTLITGIAANEKGQVYKVSFEAGPTVYEDPTQATRADDRFTIELMRGDGSVLEKHVVTPGDWTGKEAFTKHTFNYQGDGSGVLRFRISPVPTGDTRFIGALSHLQIFLSGRPGDN